MNRDSDEQRAVAQTLCGALQKEANCKCLVLSVLIYGCLAAVTWCRCANVPKVVINFDNYPLKRTEHVSPCDEGYIYIPVAFMGMLYLVYLVECYHSPIRIDLFHAESQDNVITKLSQLRLAQPTIWWKAVCYHYVRRKRQITRYRNGDNYTTTQVYYERANTHASTSFYFYDYCGVKDISKDLTTDAKIPITKITLTKGFAFSNMRSATEFEEARSRFFAEQELRDDYMEMREGLDLGYNFNPTTVVGILGNPWFTNSYVYWCLSALLLSWPLRIIIEYNTQYADYQVTKLFGVNYDTPTSGDQIHESSSQLSAPGSYMLAPSYSEALLMEPSPQVNAQASDEATRVTSSVEDVNGDIVPSYSEALLYERAQQCVILPTSNDDNRSTCDCFCHVVTKNFNPREENQNEATTSTATPQDGIEFFCTRCGSRNEEFSSQELAAYSTNFHQNSRRFKRLDSMKNSWSQSSFSGQDDIQNCRLTRDLSAPNFPTNRGESIVTSGSQFLRLNGNSLENILEHEEPAETMSPESSSRVHSSFGTEQSGNGKNSVGCGTIPKRKIATSATNDSGSCSYRLIENPMDEGSGCVERKIPSSKTYFCLKSILKQHRRRYTLVTPEELQKFAAEDPEDVSSPEEKSRIPKERRAQLFGRDPFFWRNRETHVQDQKIQRVSSSRSLIFPSPIEEACRTIPNDPFGGKAVHVLASKSGQCKPPDYGEAMGLPKLTKLAKSLTSIQHKSLSVDSPQRSRGNRLRPGSHRRNLSIEPEYLLETCRWNGKGKDETTDGNDFEIDVLPSCSIETEIETNNSAMPIQLRRNLRRGFSLNDGKERLIRNKFVRTSLAETSGSSFSFNGEGSQDENNFSSSKRFNLSMETSL